MTAKRNSIKGNLVLRFRDKDSSVGVTRETWRNLANGLGMSETEAIHQALAEFASRNGDKKLVQGFPKDLSGWDFSDFARFLKKADPEWVANAGRSDAPEVP